METLAFKNGLTEASVPLFVNSGCMIICWRLLPPLKTRESVTTFSDKCKDFKLVKAEILDIINLRPFSNVEL